MKSGTNKRKLEVRIKLWPLTVLTMAALLMPLAGGCSVFGTDTSAPTTVERAIFVTKTNYVPVTVVQTNTVLATNTVVQFQTNTVGQVLTVTNEVTVPQYQTVLVTNLIPQYENTVSTNTANVVHTGGGILNTFFPGVGSVASAGVMALLALWAQLRSGKRQDTSAALAQEVETMLEFIKTLPNGVQYTQAITAWLQAHQLEAGVANQVLGLLENEVSNPDAKAAIEQVKNTLAAVQGTTVGK